MWFCFVKQCIWRNQNDSWVVPEGPCIMALRWTSEITVVKADGCIYWQIKNVSISYMSQKSLIVLEVCEDFWCTWTITARTWRRWIKASEKMTCQPQKLPFSLTSLHVSAPELKGAFMLKLGPWCFLSTRCKNMVHFPYVGGINEGLSVEEKNLPHPSFADSAQLQ